LVLAKKLAGNVELEPTSQEDIEASLAATDPGTVAVGIATSHRKLVIQAKQRSTAAWDLKGIAALLKHGGTSRVSAKDRLKDPSVHYLLVTSAPLTGVAGGLRIRQFGQPGDASGMPASLKRELHPGAEGRVDIATQLELSRTPVREAFSRLEQEGLVLRAGGWGYVVKGITLREALGIYSVRAALETEAMREAIPHVQSEHIQRLRALLQKADERLQQKRLKEYRDYTRAFYRAIASLTDNACLEHLLSLIDDRIRWLGAMITARNFERPRESLKGNRVILDALEARDAAAAEAAVRAHVDGAKQSFMRHVNMG
jgi:DNA-binding GntR family transcriptional regulator